MMGVNALKKDLYKYISIWSTTFSEARVCKGLKVDLEILVTLTDLTLNESQIFNQRTVHYRNY